MLPFAMSWFHARTSKIYGILLKSCNMKYIQTLQLLLISMILFPVPHHFMVNIILNSGFVLMCMTNHYPTWLVTIARFWRKSEVMNHFSRVPRGFVFMVTWGDQPYFDSYMVISPLLMVICSYLPLLQCYI